MKILAIKWRRLGDTVLWTSALAAIRERFPNVDLGIAYPKAFSDLFAGDDRFSHQILLEDNLRQNLPLMWENRSRKYDYVVNFHASSRSRAFTSMLGPRRKVIHHHRRKPLRFGSDIPIPELGKPMSAIERDLNAVRAMGWEGQAPPTSILVSDSERQRGFQILTEAGWDSNRPLLIIVPDASRAAKLWPIERYYALAKEQMAQFDVCFISENKRRDPIGFSVSTPALKDLLAILGHAKLFVGSDSGVKHLACALGIPTITLFGPESIGEWHPYDVKTHRTLQIPVSCRSNDATEEAFAWCGESVCPLASHACMSNISVEQVSELVNDLR